MDCKNNLLKILDELESVFEKIENDNMNKALTAILKAKKIFCIGAGRSGIMLNTFCMRLNQLGFEAYIAGGLPCPPAADGDLLIVASSSGKTPSINSITMQGIANGADAIIITTEKEHAEKLNINKSIIIPTPSNLVNKENKVSGQPMKALFEQTLFLVCEAIIWTIKNRNNITDEEMASRHANLE